MRFKRKEYWIFLIPAMVTFILFIFIPFVFGSLYSFTDWNGVSSDFNIVGISNYIKAFNDEVFTTALLKTIIFSGLTVIFTNIIGLAFAFIVTQKGKFTNFMRGAFFFPNLIGGIILGFIWQFVFTQVFVFIGDTVPALSPVFNNWLASPYGAFAALVVVTTWQLSGYVMLIYIAAINNMPEDILEAADIDGASEVVKFFKVKIPLLMSGFTVALFFTLSSTLKAFDLNLSLTDGGPFNSTTLATLDIYRTGFSQGDFGLAQSKAIIFLVIVATVSIFQVLTTKTKEIEY